MENKSLSSIKKVTTSSNLKFNNIHESREAGLKISREIIGISSRSIRAAHRGENKKSQELIDEGIKKLKSVKPKIIKYSSDINSTFMLDGEKELCEAIFFMSFTSNKSIPTKYIDSFSPSSLLKGMAEAASELRRTALDKIRDNQVADSEKYLEIMNEVVDVLESVDFPEGVTSGLRRTTDQLRSVVERTRGDITIALERKELERSINSLKEELNK
ncbi:MAG: haloacid dehalogenase [Chloroflexota bacterium]|nr:haloacid dehalogenase [Chloroflexota bacterium]